MISLISKLTYSEGKDSLRVRRGNNVAAMASITPTVINDAAAAVAAAVAGVAVVPDYVEMKGMNHYDLRQI